MFRRGLTIPHGWTLAPPIVEREIFLIWQEEDLPAELKNAPGHIPFSASPETETWIDAMIEVRELQAGKERHVVGRPAPVAAPQPRRLVPSRSSTPTPPPAPPSGSVAPPRLAPKAEPKPEAPAMPEIVLGRSLDPHRSRRAPPSSSKDERPVMPEIGSGGLPRQAPDEEVLMPEIDV